jgi:hypothetical protein
VILGDLYKDGTGFLYCALLFVNVLHLLDGAKRQKSRKIDEIDA